MELSSVFVPSIILLTVIFVFYKWAIPELNYFKKRGIPALCPIPIFGNSADFFTKKIDFIDFVQKLYNDFPDTK